MNASPRERQTLSAQPAVSIPPGSDPSPYASALSAMVELLEQARRAAARVVNSIMTATYWELGRRIVECEQQGGNRAGYGE